MPSLKSKEVNNVLMNKGFVKESGDHNKFRLVINGKKTLVRTMTSHNNQEIGAELQSKMARQMNLTKSEFLLFISCQLSEEEYIARLKYNGVI